MEQRPSLTARLLRLAAPVALGRLGFVALGVTDTIVVGQIASSQLAWQALGWTINGPALIGGIGLLLGVQVLAARAAGGGMPEAAGEAWRKGLVIAVGAGVLIAAFIWLAVEPLFSLFGISPELVIPASGVARVLAISLPFHFAFIASTNFLEALQRPMPGAVAMWVANGVNLALNLWLVPQSGAIGSAWATVLSRVFLFVAIAVHIIDARYLKAYLASFANANRITYRGMLTIGVAAAVSAAVEAVAFASLGVLAARIDATSVAVFNIATGGIVTLVFMIALGFSTAGTVVVSDAIGRGDGRETVRAGWGAIFFTMLGMILCGGLCFLFARDLALTFTADPDVVAALVGVMGLVALLMIPDGGQGVTDAVLRARGANWYPTTARMFAFVAIAPALAWWLAEHEHRGLMGIMQALVVASSLAYALLLVRLVFMRRPV